MQFALCLGLVLVATSTFAACGTRMTAVGEGKPTGMTARGLPGTYCYDSNTMADCGGGITRLYDCDDFCAPAGKVSVRCAPFDDPAGEWDVACYRQPPADGAAIAATGDPGRGGASD
jgi:hypothetical protein